MYLSGQRLLVFSAIISVVGDDRVNTFSLYLIHTKTCSIFCLILDVFALYLYSLKNGPYSLFTG